MVPNGPTIFPLFQLPPNEAAMSERPRRFWHGTKLSELTLFRRSADRIPHVLDRVRFKTDGLATRVCTSTSLVICSSGVTLVSVSVWRTGHLPLTGRFHVGANNRQGDDSSGNSHQSQSLMAGREDRGATLI